MRLRPEVRRDHADSEWPGTYAGEDHRPEGWRMMPSPGLANESARRSAQNRAYAALALEHLDPADRTLAWLFPPSKPPRQKVLEELGRIAVLDQESCYPMAV